MNTVGMRTLFLKEVRRFLRVPGQTILSPLISTTLYFVVFGYSIGTRVKDVHGVPYIEFIVPGLVFLGIANNAFLNSSSSLFITKIQGTVVDMLVAPLGAVELLFGFISGAMTRGLIVGLCTWGVAMFFTGVHVAHAPLVALVLLLISYNFGVLGMLSAIWAEKFEQVNFFPTFVMLPLTFLGGVFYSVDRLPRPWRDVSLFNPIVYMVDALRYGMLGGGDFSPWIGVAMLGGVGAIATGVAARWLRRGYKLKT
ncbi:MAG: ABC transporter permease [Myxococcaceae bacterium]|nr:ABC transporter permease [Myxococcaceae bacterium]